MAKIKCPTCEQSFDTYKGNFHKNNARPNGYSIYCCKCIIKTSRKYRNKVKKILEDEYHEHINNYPKKSKGEFKLSYNGCWNDLKNTSLYKKIQAEKVPFLKQLTG